MHALCMINFLGFQLYILISFNTISRYEQVIKLYIFCDSIKENNVEIQHSLIQMSISNETEQMEGENA